MLLLLLLLLVYTFCSRFAEEIGFKNTSAHTRILYAPPQISVHSSLLQWASAYKSANTFNVY